ncbi:MAG: DUF1800 domain-containing protein [Candidatus Hydrogenedentes bacterium]|nr:DUF1800 domain-containing protein [Candidatus Hydrogenedentota bacterium]
MATPLLKPIDSWSAANARHLLNRAGFGGPSERLTKIAAMTPEEAVSFLVDFTAQPTDAGAPEFVVAVRSPEEVRREMEGLSVEERRAKANEYQQEERAAIQKLKGWWLERMHTTERPLEEKLTLFWHGHFATSAQKVKSSWHTHQLNDVFRRNAAGNFKQLTIDVGQSPSMLRYLDNNRSTKKHPNENWARELMELFTLGQGQYTEDDIKESARAFTGWTADHQKFAYRFDYHDGGPKTFMGKTGNFDGWDVINIIFEQPAASRFIAAKLWKYFAYDDPEKEIVEGLAQTLRENNYELRPMLRQMFASRAFYGDKAVARQVKSPAQFVVQLAFDMRYENPPYVAMARACQSLGQDLFFPPNVKGWDGNLAWVNANAMLTRYNLPQGLLAANVVKDARMETTAKKPGGESMEPAMQDTMMSPKTDDMPERWDAREFLLSLGFNTPNECVTKLAEHFLCVPLTDAQRAELLAALEPALGPDQSMNRKNVNPKNLFAAMHLLLSTAEYQLC